MQWTSDYRVVHWCACLQIVEMIAEVAESSGESTGFRTNPSRLASNRSKRYLCAVIQIRVLSFDGCPNTIPAVDFAHDVVLDLGVGADIEHVVVSGEIEAAKYRFLGSPSVQVDGRYIETERREDKTGSASSLQDSHSSAFGAD